MINELLPQQYGDFMKIVQINAVYEKYSTGRTTKEMHEYFLSQNIDSYVAAPDLNGCSINAYKIGNSFDRKLHAVFSRVLGLQGYFSIIPTFGLIRYLDRIHPNVIILRNLHSNYINIKMITKYIAKRKIPTIIVLHDCWFYTGKCVYYIEDNCDKWRQNCGNCPALRKGNTSLFFDRSRKMLTDKKKWFSEIDRLAVVGVSKWVSDDAAKSILKNAVHTYIYNWIDLEKFKRRDQKVLKEKYGLENRIVVLGIAAIWSTSKGIGVFNELADNMSSEYTVVLVGDTSNVREKKESIYYMGSIADVDKLIDMYSLADVFINPSIQETFGKTTAEAISCGTPVVAYNGTATPEIIGDDESCGILINSLNYKDYIDAIIKIVNSKVDYHSTCRKRAQKLFDKSTNIAKYMQLIQTLTNDLRDD